MLSFVYQYGKNKGPKTEGNPKELLKSVYPVFPVSVYIWKNLTLRTMSCIYNLLQFSITYDYEFWTQFLIGLKFMVYIYH